MTDITTQLTMPWSYADWKSVQAAMSVIHPLGKQTAVNVGLQSRGASRTTSLLDAHSPASTAAVIL
jgi:hypothetical protein